MKKKLQEIDEKYFQRYAGRKSSYQRVYLEHTMAPECIEMFKARGAPKIKRVCVLGTATGEVLKSFHRAFRVKPWGCEISAWAHKKIRPQYRRKIRRQDLREYLRERIRREEQFDLIFTNSLIYLDKKDIPAVLKNLSQTTRFVHFCSSFKGKACPDPWRKTLESYRWWRKQFQKAGFKEHLNSKGQSTFLWEAV